MSGEPQAPRCHIPWQEMNIDADGNVTPCCNWLSHRNAGNPYCGNVKTQSLLEIWNGEVYQNLRKYMAAGDYEKSGCANCTIILRGTGSAFRCDPDVDLELTNSPPDALTPYARNIKTLRHEIAQGATVLRAMPTVISAVPSYSCNLRCLHCYQEPVRTKDLNRPSLLDEIRELVPTLSVINCGGGEPLILPLWRDFLDQLDLTTNPYLAFGTCTNASVLTERALKAIGQFKNLNLGVSVDAGSKEVYERIRVNGTFEAINANIDKLLGLIKARPDSVLSLSMSVMRDNITDIANFMQFATGKGVAFSLSPVMSMPADQCLTCLNDAESDLVQWRAALDHASDTIEQLQLTGVVPGGEEMRDNYRRQLKFVRDQIPWEIERPTYLVSGEVFQELLQRHRDAADEDTDNEDTGRLLLFWPCVDGKPSVARYFSKITGGRFAARLPEGAYFLGIVPRFGWPCYEADWLVDVLPNGRVARRPKGRLTATGEFAAAISSGDLSPYRAASALESNTNAWNSLQAGSAVPGNAYIGVDFLMKKTIDTLRVHWVVPYATPSRIAIQFSDDGEDWVTSTEVGVKSRRDSRTFWWDEFAVPETREHRWWRILALTTTPGDGSLAVAELCFLDTASAPKGAVSRSSALKAAVAHRVPRIYATAAWLKSTARTYLPHGTRDQREVLWAALRPRRRQQPREHTSIVMLAISNLRIDPRVLREAQSLVAAGFIVKIIYPDTDRPYFHEQPLDWGPGIAFCPLPWQAATFTTASPWLLGEMMLQAACKESPLAFHCHDLSTAVVGLAAAGKTGALCVCDFHEWFSENVSWNAENRRYEPHPRLQKLIYRWAERLCLLKADAIITVCDSIADELVRMVPVPRSVHLIRNIPALDAKPTTDYPPLKTQIGIPNDRFLMLWQGGTGPTRLIEPIIKALALAPGVHFVIRGPSLDLFGEGYRALAEKCGVGDRLVLLPPVPSRDVVAAARGADAGIWSLPNLSKNFYYALPNKVFEYLASGLPVLGADFPEVRKLIVGNGVGLCFEPTDPASIAAQINRLVRDPELAEAMRATIPSVLASLDAEHEWQKLVALYQSFTGDELSAQAA